MKWLISRVAKFSSSTIAGLVIARFCSNVRSSPKANVSFMLGLKEKLAQCYRSLFAHPFEAWEDFKYLVVLQLFKDVFETNIA